MSDRMKGGFSLLLAAVLLGGCGGEELNVVEEADAGGIGFTANGEAGRDSIRVVVEITNNTDTSADITLNGGCPITVIVRNEVEEVVWDEREHRACEEEDRTLPLAPHEYRQVSHSIARSQEGLELEPDSELLARVLVAADAEYIIRAD